ncbi:ATP/GTP-binding protein [Lutibaculum baratangense AMV1]|uniref:Putative pyruvate, phosphate dikinase regulatory protein n=1 Tax=Lutibaculum baratangense AMV1 TaxID=631454 RepID=V4RIZ2_9HYPH|nr:ATP/GTP-binding protein [Lutibaculum baratangense AMV1]
MKSYVHLHLISDSTGETLIAVGRAAAAQYVSVRAVEHVYPLIRSTKQLERVLNEIEISPGIVLYTLVSPELVERLEQHCEAIGAPCVSVLSPVLNIFRSYLGTESTPRVGGQHVLDSDYFRRIDALNYTLVHDDGQNLHGLKDADVVLTGISRTSKTPTSIYLANRGIKAANVPLIPSIPVPAELEELRGPLVVGLLASPERIVQIRQNRVLTMGAADLGAYVDKAAVAEEIAYTRKLCARHGWPMIDVTRRSIEETAAAIMALYREKRTADDGGLEP